MKQGMAASIPYKNEIIELTGLEYCELEDLLERSTDYEGTVYTYLTGKGYALDPPESPKASAAPLRRRTGAERDVWTKEKILFEKEKLLREREKLLIRKERRLNQTESTSIFSYFSVADIAKAAIMIFLFFCLFLAWFLKHR